MAKRRRKPRERQEDTSIRFENLDGTPDDEHVDPLDSEPGEPSGGDDDADPRAEDPFSDDTLDDDDDRPEPRMAEAERDEDESEDEGDEGEPDEDRGKSDDDVGDPDLQALLDDTRRELEEARRDGDLSRQQLEEANKALYDSRTKEVDEGLTRARAALKRAIEDGDTDKQVEITEEIADHKAAKKELERLKERADRQEKERPREERQAEQDTPNIRAQTPAAERWMRGRNWINNPAYKQQNQDLIRIAGILVDDGYDPQRSDYYQELERRMKRRHPDLFSNGRARPQRRPDRQAVSRVSRDDPPQREAGNRVVITAEDKRNMTRFGLDPSNKDHLREYAKNKIPERV